MFKTPTLTSTTLIIAIASAVCACQFDESAQPPAAPAAPAMLLQASPQPSTFVGTVPLPRADEPAITPAETVGAAAN